MIVGLAARFQREAKPTNQSMKVTKRREKEKEKELLLRDKSEIYAICDNYEKEWLKNQDTKMRNKKDYLLVTSY